jgi:hypothetical protein
MARYNEILAGRFNRYLQKLMGMKGGPPAPQLASEISVSLPLFSGCEDRNTQGWNLFGIVISQPAVGAVTGGIRFRNPTGSNVIAVFTKLQAINIQPGTADSPTLQNGAIAADLSLAISLANARLDSRGNPNPTLIASRSNAVSAPTLANNMGQVSYGATPLNYDILQDPMEFPLLPGDAIQWLAGAVNIQLGMAFMWRERTLEESELR